MAAGNISDVERIKRLNEMDKLIQENENITNTELAEKLGMAVTTVSRNKKYLEELKKSDISNEEVARKRSELYLELASASEEAKELFDICKNPQDCPYCDGKGVKEDDKGIEKKCSLCKGSGRLEKFGKAIEFHKRWVETIDRMMKLYGLDNIKNDGFLINQQFNFVKETSEKLPIAAAEKMSEIYKKVHESKTQ